MKIYADVNTTKKDYISFQKHHILKFVWIYVLVALLVALILVMLIKSKNSTGEINVLYAMCFGIVCVLFVYMILNSVIRIIRSAKKEEAKPMFSYTFTKGGVHCESGGRSFDLPWTNVYKVTETEPMFLVYINKDSAFIVPKRCFKSEEDISEFRSNLLFAPRKTSKKKAKK